MEEYILYVILIFVPIGGAMVYLLHKDGLPGKYINIIVILSLLIILSFPICMERLGGLVSLLIYVLLIAVMSWYILKGRIGDLVLFTGRSPVGSRFINNLINRERSAILVTNETSVDDESGIVETTKEIPEKEEMPEEIMETEIATEGGIKLDEGLQSESSLIDSAPASEVNEVTPIMEAEETSELSEEKTGEVIEIEVESEADLTSEKSEAESQVDLTSKVILEEKQAEEHLPEATASSEDTALPKDIDVQVDTLILETIEPALVDAEIDEIDEMDEMDEISELQREKQDLAHMPIPDRQELETASQVQIIELIDNGFACRDNNREEAARYFEEAWQTTSEYELRYMLTVELLEIYKECGWYSRAGSILDSFITLPGHKSDIINEINRKIDYISLLAAELKRLGISDLPISRVPRWVRLKVDGEMNPPGV